MYHILSVPLSMDIEVCFHVLGSENFNLKMTFRRAENMLSVLLKAVQLLNKESCPSDGALPPPSQAYCPSDLALVII